jgi:hypothetical protein
MYLTKAIRLEDLGYELRMISPSIEKAAENALNLDLMVLAAKAFCPVDTGALMSSVRAERKGPLESDLVAGGIQYINIKTMQPVLYAEYVHDGTSTTPARPFLLQAVLLERQRMLQRILEESGMMMG